MRENRDSLIWASHTMNPGPCLFYLALLCNMLLILRRGFIIYTEYITVFVFCLACKVEDQEANESLGLATPPPSVHEPVSDYDPGQADTESCSYTNTTTPSGKRTVKLGSVWDTVTTNSDVTESPSGLVYNYQVQQSL